MSPDEQQQGGPQRVVILIDSLVGGGAERVAVSLAAGLDRRRFQPHLLVTRHGGPLESFAHRHDLPITILGRRRGFSPRRLARAVRLVRSSALVHAHKFPGGCWGVLIGRMAGRPAIVHEHSAYGGRRTAVRTLLYRQWIGRLAKAVICVSEDIVTSLRQEGVPAPLLRLIPNGVSLTDVADRAEARSALGLAPDELVVGIIGRLAPEKRHDLLLRATARLREEGSAFQVCIVGGGTQRPALESLAGELGIEDAVVWAGEHDDAGRLAGAFDIAVLCSDFEGLPLAALEALAAGVPLVATAVGALPGLVSEGVGISVPAGDFEALAGAIRQLLADAALRERMGAAGRELASRRFSVERAVAEVERIYEGVLGDPGR